MMLMAAGGTGSPRPDQRRTGLSQPGSGPAPSNVLVNPVIIVTPGKGLFVYDPSPAAGNLIASFAATSGTDSYGNAYLPGVTGYGVSGDTAYATQIGTLGSLVFYQSDTGEAGPYGLTAEIAATSSGMGIAPLGSLQDLTAGGLTDLWTLVGFFCDRFLISSTADTPDTDALLEVQGTAAVELIEAIVGGVAETWHAMTLVNSWGNVSGYHAASYRLTAQGDVQLTGRITNSGVSSGLIFTLPSGYYSTSYSIGCVIDAVASSTLGANQTPRIVLDTNGDLTVAGFVASDAFTCDIDCTLALSAG